MNKNPTYFIGPDNPKLSPDFAPGFRISLTDVVFIILFSLWLWFARSIDTNLFVLSVWPPAQFFLFCNVFRIARKSELIWVCIYLATALPCYNYGFSPFIPLAAGIMAGLVAIAHETRKPSYHGVFWQHFNPELESWFRENSRAS